MQLQTAISPGNSGGPVLDNYASIIGLISFSRSDAQNLDYAISVDEIDSFLRRHDAKMGIGSKPPVSARAEYSVAPSSGGRQVIRVQYPERTAYLMVDSDGKVLGVVADGGNGASVQAWQPAAPGGFQQWRATFSDGKTAEGSGQNGQPTRFVMRRK